MKEKLFPDPHIPENGQVGVDNNYTLGGLRGKPGSLGSHNVAGYAETSLRLTGGYRYS